MTGSVHPDAPSRPAPFHVIGIDAGGTKTICLLADASGRIVSRARGPGANLQSIGELQVEKVLHDVMDQALGETDVVPAAICIGIAGVDRPDDHAIVKAIMERIGFKARILIVNDALIALEAGAPGASGVVIISGTGSIAYGRNDEGEAARAGGWGYVLGDEGSGYWIGRAALRAVLRAADQRGPATQLTPMLLEYFGVTHPHALLHHVYHQNLMPAAIGALAECVQRAFTAEDPIAVGILAGAAEELEAGAMSVAKRLRLVGTPFSFILSGGIFRAVPWLHSELVRRLAIRAPGATVRLLDREPAEGAVVLAIQEARGGARVPTYNTIKN